MFYREIDFAAIICGQWRFAKVVEVRRMARSTFCGLLCLTIESWFYCDANCVSVRGMSSHCLFSLYFPSLYFQGLVLGVLFYFVGSSIQEGRGPAMISDFNSNCFYRQDWAFRSVRLWKSTSGGVLCRMARVPNENEYLGTSYTCSWSGHAGWEGRHFKASSNEHTHSIYSTSPTERTE
jgi:hypothetical protein